MPPSTIDRAFLDCSATELSKHSSRIDACLEQLTEDQIWARGGENENAVGNLVLHLCGNVRQWIIGGVGGAPEARDRDAEFAARGSLATSQLRERLAATVDQAVRVIAAVPAARLRDRLQIQGYEVSVLEAIYHVVEHFSGHTGQIIFATKMLTGADLGFYRHLSSAAAHGHQKP